MKRTMASHERLVIKEEEEEDRQGKTRQDNKRQDKTCQDKTRHDETTKDNERQDKARQDKTQNMGEDKRRHKKKARPSTTALKPILTQTSVSLACMS